MVDPTGTGKKFVAAKNPKSTGTQKITLVLPAGTQCTGGKVGNLCLLSVKSTAGFGGCTVVSQLQAATSTTLSPSVSATKNPCSGKHRRAAPSRHASLRDKLNTDTSQGQPPILDTSLPPAKKVLPTRKAHWTLDDETAFIGYVWDHRAEGGDGCNFKMSPTWNGAAWFLNESITKGGAKNGKGCKGKWAAFKKVYDLVQLVKSQSGWTWTDAGGASITPETASTWTDFVANNPDVARFRNKGWHHLSAIEPLMSGITPKGTHVFRASQTAPIVIDDDGDGDGDFDDDDTLPAGPVTQQYIAQARYSPPWQSFQDEEEEEDACKSSSPIPETPLSRRKRTSACTGGGTVAKKARISGADAIRDLSASVHSFGDIVREVLIPHSTSGLEATLCRKQRAIQRAQKVETYLGIDNLVSIMFSQCSRAPVRCSLNANPVFAGKY
ncbi:hypothetical protein B0H10DRAFT_1956732 [Mycena sp. CBHHK59/15]|nr:hypothetical protein B0H10DRAFT_1956732 [Mycena sp. CBHHK59/15]